MAKTKQEKGWVYVLTNPSMPGVVKIGHTHRSVGARMKDMDVTEVPTPFEKQYEALCKGAERVERKTHQLLAKLRPKRNREFFKCDPAVAINGVREAAKELGVEILHEEKFYVEQVNEPAPRDVHSADSQDNKPAPKDVHSADSQDNVQKREAEHNCNVEKQWERWPYLSGDPDLWPDLDDQYTVNAIFSHAISDRKARKYYKFTGWVREVYRSGRGRRLYYYREGLLHGPFVFWYKNGAKEKLGAFMNDQLIWENDYYKA